MLRTSHSESNSALIHKAKLKDRKHWLARAVTSESPGMVLGARASADSWGQRRREKRASTLGRMRGREKPLMVVEGSVDHVLAEFKTQSRYCLMPKLRRSNEFRHVVWFGS